MKPEDREPEDTGAELDTETDPPPPGEDPPASEPKSSLDALNAALDGPEEEAADEGTAGEETHAAGVQPDAGKGAPPAKKAGDVPRTGAPAGQDPTGDPATTEPSETQGADPLIDEPLPPGLKEGTRKRFEQLVTRYKGANQELEQLRPQAQQLQQFQQAIQSTGADPEQFAASLEYLRLSNSRDPADQKRALEILRADLRALSLRVGEVPPEIDVLADHPDLREAVDRAELDEAHARELAIARSRRAAEQRTHEQGNQANEQQQAIARGKAEVNAMEQRLRASDPHYAAKREHLLPFILPVLRNIPPDKWAETWAEAYKKLPADFAPPPARETPPAPGNGTAPRAPSRQTQPLRHRVPAGGAHREAKSSLEALNIGLDQYRST